LTAVEDRPAPTLPVAPETVAAATIRPDTRGARIGRVAWGMADQIMSSATNFLTGLFAARALGPSGFGYFSLLWTTYAVILTMSRGLATDPLTVRFSDGAADRRVLRDAIARSTGLAVAFGTLVAVLAVTGGALLGGNLGHGFMALGVVAPTLLLQDAWRYASLCSAAPRQALLNDTVWGIALVPAIILAAPHAGAGGFVLAWGAAAAVAAAFGFVQWRIRPHVGGALGWLREHRDLSTRYVFENVSVSGTGQIIAFGLGGLAGIAAVGSMRGAQQLLGPFTVLLYGISFVVVPEGTRILRASPHRFRTFCLGIGATLCTGALSLGVVLEFVPARYGRMLLGQVWDPAHPLLLPCSFVLAAAGMSTGAGCGLRAMGAARRSLPTQLRSSAITVVGGLSGAALDGARGCCWGMAGAVAIGATLMWRQFGLALREWDVPGSPAPAPMPVELRI
jgi:O-antigen/teichoic acid export membrane protein